MLEKGIPPRCSLREPGRETEGERDRDRERERERKREGYIETEKARERDK